MLAGLFAAFTVVNRVVPVRAALGLVPRAYYPVAVVLSIAVTFVPSTLHAVQQIREAQAVRGRSMRGLGSWLPLIIPLLEGSLERSMQLAEAMMARGFASAEARPNQTPQALFLIGLGGVVGGWLLRLVWQQALAGTLLLAASFVALGLGLWLAGRQHPHTVYRPGAVAARRRADRCWRGGDGCGLPGAAAWDRPRNALLLPLSGAELAGVGCGDRRGDVGVGGAGGGGGLALNCWMQNRHKGAKKSICRCFSLCSFASLRLCVGFHHP